MSLLINSFPPSFPSLSLISLGSWRLLVYFLYRLVRIYRSEAERFPLLSAVDPSLVDAGCGCCIVPVCVQLPDPAVSRYGTVSRYLGSVLTTGMSLIY